MIYSYDKSVLETQHVEPIFERDTSSMTEQAGYVDAETQVKRMIVAGANLMAFRKGMFDYDDGVVPDDVQPDPTMDVGFDLADASQILDNAKAAAAALQKEGAKGETSPESGVPKDSSK